MADMYSSSKRSEIMSKIKSKNTIAEKIVFTFLRQEHIYYQKHYDKAVGKPDIALPRKRKAVFIDGDFWHGREIERLKSTRTSDDFWVMKILGNIERDVRQRQKLLDDGWQVLAVWESDIKRKRTRDGILLEIKSFLQA